MENFNSAWTYANLLYGIELDSEEFEEIGMVAWNRIGNKQTRLYRYIIDVDCANKEITLPCNCDYIEAITNMSEDWNEITNNSPYGDYSSQFTENYIEGLKRNKNPYYSSGKFVKYERVGNNLYFDEPYGKLQILYKGVELDEDGLPYINEKEKDAIACFCAYIVKYREGLATHNQALLTEAQMLEQRWMKMCDSARVAERVSQNDMNLILDARTNWNRKSFNKSYKPLR